MSLTLKQRIAVLGLLVLLFLTVYGVSRHYSPAIVAFVVEQALMQKAPEGVSPVLIRQRFAKLIGSTPADAKLKRLLALSSYLEKVQKLTPAELDRLLTAEGIAPRVVF